MDQRDIDNRFDYHPPSHPGTQERHSDTRLACKLLAKALNELLPESREKDKAFDFLEDVMFWSNAAIARNT